jgi:hypothetical protein
MMVNIWKNDRLVQAIDAAELVQAIWQELINML